jgi:hypothetical protein
LEAAPAATTTTIGERAKIGTQAISASDVSLSFESRRSESKGKSQKVEAPKKVEQKGRVQRIPEDAIKYMNELKKDKHWEYKGKAPNGKTFAYKNVITKEVRYVDEMHNEIECFLENGKHQVIDPVTGKLIPEKCGKHTIPQWLK